MYRGPQVVGELHASISVNYRRIIEQRLNRPSLYHASKVGYFNTFHNHIPQTFGVFVL